MHKFPFAMSYTQCEWANHDDPRYLQTHVIWKLEEVWINLYIKLHLGLRMMWLIVIGPLTASIYNNNLPLVIRTPCHIGIEDDGPKSSTGWMMMMIILWIELNVPGSSLPIFSWLFSVASRTWDLFQVRWRKIWAFLTWYYGSCRMEKRARRPSLTRVLDRITVGSFYQDFSKTPLGFFVFSWRTNVIFFWVKAYVCF